MWIEAIKWLFLLLFCALFMWALHFMLHWGE